jgi:hypothetical protein
MPVLIEKPTIPCSPLTGRGCLVSGLGVTRSMPHAVRPEPTPTRQSAYLPAAEARYQKAASARAAPVMVALPAARHEGVLQLGSNTQASNGSPGEKPRASPTSQKPQAVVLNTRTVTLDTGRVAAGDARQLASKFAFGATVGADVTASPTNGDAPAAKTAKATATTNTTTTAGARRSCVLVVAIATEVTPGCGHRQRAKAEHDHRQQNRLAIPPARASWWS